MEYLRVNFGMNVASLISFDTRFVDSTIESQKGRDSSIGMRRAGCASKCMERHVRFFGYLGLIRVFPDSLIAFAFEEGRRLRTGLDCLAVLGRLPPKLAAHMNALVYMDLITVPAYRIWTIQCS